MMPSSRASSVTRFAAYLGHSACACPPCCAGWTSPATGPVCCGQDMQQRIGVDLSHIIQPPDFKVPGGEDEYDPEQGGAF